MNRHTWQVFSYELKRNLRRKGFLFTTFGIPLIAFALLVGYRAITQANAANKPPESSGSSGAEVESEGPQFDGIKRAGFVDLSGEFGNAEDLGDALVRYHDEVAATGALAAGEIDAYYVIDADYLKTGDVTQVVPRFSLNTATDAPIRQMILNHLASDIHDEDLFNRLLNPSNVNEVNLQRDATGQTGTNFGADFAVVYIFAFALMMSVFMTNGYLMQTVVEEKETRLIEILVSTMRPTDLLAGKILAFGLMGLVQIVVWIAALMLIGRYLAGDAASPLMALSLISLSVDKVLILLLYFMFGYLFFAAGYGMVGAISNSMQEGPQFAVIFTLPAVIPFYFISLFITTPDAPLPVALSIIPITAPLAMVMR
ncbi:MAG: ABC transporter permease, partial [Anaerolineae bacterium]|nr:ABC transporter permease [Anaerolineae bacterium]